MITLHSVILVAPLGCPARFSGWTTDNQFIDRELLTVNSYDNKDDLFIVSEDEQYLIISQASDIAATLKELRKEHRLS